MKSTEKIDECIKLYKTLSEKAINKGDIPAFYNANGVIQTLEWVKKDED